MSGESNGGGGLFAEDLDRLFSYNTKQQVKVLDRFLGFTNIALCLGIVTYIVGYVFVIDKGYLEYEQAAGIAATHVSGSLVASSQAAAGAQGGAHTRFFGADEIAYPPLENGNVFITTKLEVTSQHRDTCLDPERPCEADDECFRGTCDADQGLCLEKSWCEDPKNPKQVYKLDKADDALQIWVKSAIQFYRLRKSRIFKNDMGTPIPGENTFTVRELLAMCEPPVQFEEVSELGAAVEVQFVWNCNVNGKPETCKPTIKARRVDNVIDVQNIGFHFGYPEYTDDDARLLHKATGIRFFFRTVGTGYQVALTAIIFKISTGIALLGFAPILADFLMLRCFKLSSKYYARKYEMSPDFSDYFDQLAARQAAEAEAERLARGEPEEQDQQALLEAHLEQVGAVGQAALDITAAAGAGVIGGAAALLGDADEEELPPEEETDEVVEGIRDMARPAMTSDYQ